MLNVITSGLSQLLAEAQRQGAAGKAAEAEALYRQALAQVPNQLDASNGLALLLVKSGRDQEALELLMRVLDSRPDSAEGLHTLSVILLAQGGARLTDALVAARRAVELQPSAEHLATYGAAQLAAGRAEAAVESLRKALSAPGATPGMHSALLHALHYVPGVMPLTMVEEHKQWGRRHGPAGAPAVCRVRGEGEPLRVGYVSGKRHPAGVEALLAHHDPSVVESFYYDAAGGAVSERLQRLAKHWRPIAQVSDEAVVEMIRADGIDILVDLAGHTAGNRLNAFARRPAPVQTAFLGYPDTRGMEGMDYLLTDVLVAPPGVMDHLYTEKLLRVEGSCVCFSPPEEAPLVGGVPSLAKGHVMLGSFHEFPKINKGVVRVWAEILQKLQTARLLVKCAALDDVTPRRQLLEWFEDFGIPPARLELRGHTESFAEHLAVYNEVDIALDTFPWQGMRTTCEALYMGVPVVILVGQTHASRVGVSILTALNLSALNLPDLMAATVEQYVDMTVRLAGDGMRRGKFRSLLRSRLLGSALTDGAGFARRVEGVYRRVWGMEC